MAQILVRNVEKTVVHRLKERARRRGRSLQSEVKDILVRAAAAPQLDMAAARRLTQRIRRRFRPGRAPDSVELIRQDRDR
jgi:plasmid stability protein